MLTGLWLSLEFLSLFLNTGVIFAFFREDGKLHFSTESLNLARRMSANISAFSLIIFGGISVSWHALEVSNFKISYRISSLFIFEKENGRLGCFFHTSPMASMLGWFLYFTTHFKIGSLILLARGPQFEYSAILMLLTMLEKKVFNFSRIIVTHNNLFVIY